MATQGVLMKLQGVQNASFDENPHENERIVVILGCANCIIACAKHRYTGGWLKLCWCVNMIREYDGNIDTKIPQADISTVPSCKLLSTLWK